MILEEQVVVIECRNKNERDNIVSLFQENGFIPLHSVLLGACYIAAYKNTKAFSTFSKNVAHGGDILYTHNQFMEKYAMSDLKKKIEEAKKVTGLSASALSEKLGFQHKYLTNAVREASKQRQKEIIAKLDGLIFKEENELTHDFEGKALNVNIVDAVMVSKGEYDEMYSKNTALCVEVGQLKKALDHKNQVLDKRNAVLENHINRVNELELQLKTTQQKFVDVVDQKDSEIKKLQSDCSHATNQYQGKRAQVVQLNEKLNKQAVIYLIIIAILFIASIVGFAS